MDLAEFLVTAKQKTYASGEPGRTLADGTVEFEYQEGEFRYRDRFLGAANFIGQETVWQAGRLVWGMNYYGVAVANAPAELGKFLKAALRQVRPERPFRGPHVLIQDQLEYLDESQGGIESFNGVEQILYQGQEVYRLTYHGGVLDQP